MVTSRTRRVALSTRDNCTTACSTARAPTQITEASIRACGSKGRRTVRVSRSGRMGGSMRAVILRGKSTDLGVMTGLMARTTKETGNWISKTELLCSSHTTGGYTLASSDTVRNMVLGSRQYPTVLHSTGNTIETGKMGTESTTRNSTLRIKATILMEYKVDWAHTSRKKIPRRDADSG